MTKKELIEQLAGEGASKSTVECLLNSLARTVARELAATGEIILPGIGKLHVDEVAARTGRNPRTGEAVEIPAKKRVKFKATKDLADHVNV